ncbi:MAG: hypothetical protein BGO59_24285 [Spirosoma sp. 48-14]|nr:MAG: hypothetical protein BGO59_24285 [Spirosoma sp. 48-14]
MAMAVTRITRTAMATDSLTRMGVIITEGTIMAMVQTILTTGITITMAIIHMGDLIQRNLPWWWFHREL